MPPPTDDAPTTDRDAADLLRAMAHEVSLGHPRIAVRIALETTDAWMRDDARLAACRAVLDTAYPSRLGATATLGLLAALHPVRDQTARERAALTERLLEYLLGRVESLEDRVQQFEEKT